LLATALRTARTSGSGKAWELAVCAATEKLSAMDAARKEILKVLDIFWDYVFLQLQLEGQQAVSMHVLPIRQIKLAGKNSRKCQVLPVSTNFYLFIPLRSPFRLQLLSQ
jgi:hypothetical protein